VSAATIQDLAVQAEATQPVSNAPALAPRPISFAASQRKFLGVAFGPRFFLLLALGLLWIIPAFQNRRFLLVLFAWDALVLLAWLTDLLALPRPSRVRITRNWLEPLALRCPAAVELIVGNQSARPLMVRLIDDLPPQLAPAPMELRAAVRRRGEAVARYSIVPAHRGDAQLGLVYIRYRSPLQIAERWAVAGLQQTVRVYPNLQEAARHSLYLIRSRQIELEKRYVRLRGEGREVESLREYQVGDDLRDICWTATARRQKLITRVYQMERSQPVWLVLDCGRLMRTRVGDISKLDSAVNAALSLAQVALGSGDRVGLLCYGRSVSQLVLPGRGAPHLRQIIEQLAVAHEQAPEADHLRAAATLLGRQRRRGLVVWITDLAETAMTPEVIQGASEVASTHLLLFVVIANPELQRTAAAVPENVDQMFVGAAAQELANRRALLLAKVRDRGALAMEADWRNLSTLLVNEYLNVKERNQI
jgi:uncharacterized protein (DUF58 family)